LGSSIFLAFNVSKPDLAIVKALTICKNRDFYKKFDLSEVRLTWCLCRGILPKLLVVIEREVALVFAIIEVSMPTRISTHVPRQLLLLLRKEKTRNPWEYIQHKLTRQMDTLPERICALPWKG